VPQTYLTIALLRGLYWAIILDRYEGHQSPLTISLLRCPYWDIIMDRYIETNLPLIALLRGFNLAIIFSVMERPKLPLLQPCLEASTEYRYGGSYTALNIALLRGLYCAIILDRYEGPQTPLNIALLRGLYLDIILDRYRGILSPLTIALNRGLYWAIIMDRFGGPQTTLM
jgi:hypothetical protein